MYREAVSGRPEHQKTQLAEAIVKDVMAFA
jgi:hypothetical protein